MDRRFLYKILCLLSCVAFLAAASAVPAEEPAEAANPTDEKAYVDVTFAGMQIAVDPETGEIRPPSEAEARRLSAAMQKMFGKRVHRSMPRVTKSGDMAVVLGFEHFNYSIARVDAEGDVQLDCAAGAHEAHELLMTPATPAADEREER